MFSRRKLLEAAGYGVGASLLAPFMRQVHAQTTRPARLVLVVECNGIYPEAFLSSATRTALGTTAIGGRHNFLDTYPSTAQVRRNDGLASGLCLGSLASSMGSLSLENRAAVVLGLSSTVTGGGHSTGTGALSCAVGGSAATFDAVVAPRLKGTTPFDAIRLGTSGSLAPIAYETCMFGPGKPAPIIVNPKLAYETVFGTIAGSGQSGAKRSALFDFARDDVTAALATFSGNSNERLKLERYLTSLEALRARQSQLQAMAASVRPLLPVAPAMNPLLAPMIPAPDAMKWLEAQFQIATTALLGGLTNVVVLASGTSGFDVNYFTPMGAIGRHSLQHGIGAPAYWNAIAAVTTRHVELIAGLARTLAATPEVGASGSMLDNTAIVYMSDNGEEHHSTAVEWPMLVVGGNALGLKTDGRTVVFPSSGSTNNRQVSNFFNTLGHTVVGDTGFDTFGGEGPTRITPGPLSELMA